MIEFSAESLHSLTNRPMTEIWPPGNYYPSGLSLGMGIDHCDRLTALHDDQ